MPPQHQNIAVKQNKSFSDDWQWIIDWFCKISLANCLVCKYFMGVVKSARWQMQRAACDKDHLSSGLLSFAWRNSLCAIFTHTVVEQSYGYCWDALIQIQNWLHFHMFFVVRRLSSGPAQVAQCHTLTATIMQACPWMVLCALLNI